MDGTRSLFIQPDALSDPIPNPASGKVLEQFSLELPAYFGSRIDFSASVKDPNTKNVGISVQCVLKKETDIMSRTLGPYEVDKRLAPSRDMRIAITLPGFRYPVCVDLAIQCEHGRLTLDGLLYNVAYIIYRYLKGETRHKYLPGFPRVKQPRYFFIKSLHQPAGKDVWKTEVTLLREAPGQLNSNEFELASPDEG
ncbi:hypothetical protein V5O48_008305 [Marasmius crinis-equi]|uniref:Uncharacterized protein n=1 Tax=Marasmius crinis-equi TaxID=585013 RepID=A0ABR3FEA3_9AGAR